MGGWVVEIYLTMVFEWYIEKVITCDTKNLVGRDGV